MASESQCALGGSSVNEVQAAFFCCCELMFNSIVSPACKLRNDHPLGPGASRLTASGNALPALTRLRREEAPATDRAEITSSRRPNIAANQWRIRMEAVTSTC